MIHQYILDTNILVQYPEVLTKANKQLKLLIPQAVLDEISYGATRIMGRWGELKALVEIAISQGQGVELIKASADIPLDLHTTEKIFQKLSNTDLNVARTAIELSNRLGGSTVTVVTSDRILNKFLQLKKINSIGAQQFFDLTTNQKTNIELEKSVTNLVSSQWNFIISSFFAGILVSMLGAIAFSYRSELLSTLPIWGTIIFLPLLGIMFYWYRERYRLRYGVSELFFGIFACYYPFFPDFDYSKFNITHTIQIVGGLYVIVRGLDNIGKAIDGTKIGEYWKKIF